MLLLPAWMFGCSDNSTNPKPEISEDIISGTYFLHGTKVKLRYDFPWPSWGGDVVILEADTTQINMLVKVDLLGEKQDSVRFTGLEGVNAGEYQSVNQDCTHPSCYGDAKLMNGELSFDLSGAGGLYRGAGTLDEEKLTLDTHFEYRPTGIDYHLEGQKIITKASKSSTENEGTTVDTLYVEFLLLISKTDGREDTIRLHGLQGVDTGEGDNRVYPNCEIPEECEVFAQLEGEDLNIDINNDGRSYQATGKIYQTYDPYVEMSATYNYENTTIEYELEGGTSEE